MLEKCRHNKNNSDNPLTSRRTNGGKKPNTDCSNFFYCFLPNFHEVKLFFPFLIRWNYYRIPLYPMVIFCPLLGVCYVAM